MMKKSIISIALMFLMLCTLCVGCSDETDNTSMPEGDVSQTDIYRDENGRYVGATTGNKYDGEVVTFLTASALDSYESEILFNTYQDDGVKKTYPTSLNEDLQKRQTYVEETLGIKLEEIKINASGGPGGKMCETVRRGALTMTEDYDIIVPCLYDAASLALEGMLLDLRAMSGLQIDAPWWNSDFNSLMTHGSQLYFTIGELGITNKTHTAALYFNLDLWNKHGLTEKFGGTPYELVRQGKWTVDLVFEASKAVGEDLNQDGKIDYTDSYGWGGNRDDMWSIFFASGEKIAKTDADGYPHITMFNSRSATLMGKLQEFVQDGEHYIAADDYFSVTPWPDSLIQEGFTDGRVLFHNAGIGSIIEIGGQAEDHFGIVPVPKADEEQDGYHSLVNPWSATCFAVPSSVAKERIPLVVDVLNCMGAESMNTVSVSYQQILDYMKTRDDDSKEMLNEYILPTRSCDVGMIYKWGGLETLLHEMATSTVGTFASKFEAKKQSAEFELQEDMEIFRKKESEK